MQIRDELSRVCDCRDFFQPLECVFYLPVQIEEKSFLLLLENNFPEKTAKLFV